TPAPGCSSSSRGPPAPGGASTRTPSWSADRGGVAAVGDGRLPHPHGEHRVGTGGITVLAAAHGRGHPVVEPAGEHLHGDGVGALGEDHLVEVGVTHHVGRAGQRRVERVEVAHHPPAVELVPLHPHL